nr:hypothetical protein [Tanacetum cinerariifolium]
MMIRVLFDLCCQMGSCNPMASEKSSDHRETMTKKLFANLDLQLFEVQLTGCSRKRNISNDKEESEFVKTVTGAWLENVAVGAADVATDYGFAMYHLWDA